MRCGIVLAMLLAVTACMEKNPSSPTVPLNQQFELAPGQSANVQGASIRVSFLRVLGDSRCPADALCIQGGDAIVGIQVEPDGSPAVPPSCTPGRPVKHGDLTIELVQLSPYPFSSRTIQPDEMPRHIARHALKDREVRPRITADPDWNDSSGDREAGAATDAVHREV